jgi:hypothetical protein
MRQPSWLTNEASQGSAPAALDPAALLLVLLAVGLAVAAAFKGLMALRRSRRDRERWGDAH